MQCKVCESTTADFGGLRILNRFDARYRRCQSCGFVFVERVDWLEQAYSAAIAWSDTGVAVRNLELAATTSALIQLVFNDAQRFLDYGGGAGLFVRLMRDRGFDFWLLDKYCSNTFAGGFEAKQGEHFHLATAIEVVEHLLDPMRGFQEIALYAPAMIISTELVPKKKNRPDEWWYYAPETGQHVSFYTRDSLQVIAERLGKRLATNGRNLHVLSCKSVADWVLKVVSSRRWRPLAAAALVLAGRRRRSLTRIDAEYFQRL